MRKIRKFFWRSAQAALGLLVGSVALLNHALPDTYYVAQDQEFQLAGTPWLKPIFQSGSMETQTQQDTSGNATLALLGVVPVKTVRTVERPRRTVNVCGVPFGIKIFSQGALVVGFSDVCTAQGSCNPAKQAGLCMGDLILSADGQPVHSNEELSAAIGRAKGSEITIEYSHNRETRTTSLCPVMDDTVGRWRAGMWVRDSSAGIGTLTFCCPETGLFGGLGHAISDGDTGQQVTVSVGQAAQVKITGYEVGRAGSPGQLKGEFGPDIGTIYANDDSGVYGCLNQPQGNFPCPVAWKQEVKAGPAQMLTTIEGQEPKWYNIQIERVSLLDGDPNRNMVIRITDPELLEATGGILQGMSGSPILQNGMLVGAVTHVLISDCGRGYAIFAQTMLEEADKTAVLMENAAA